MKKIILLAAFGVAGLVSAKKSETKILANQNVQLEQNKFLLRYEILRGRIEQGLGIVDTASDGSCIVYETYYFGDNGDSIFVPASQATNSTMGLPKCSGGGNYQV